MSFFNFVTDEELIKTVLIKDFDYMVDRREFKMHNEYLDNMMTQLEGEQWRAMRALMTPVFTSGKLKNMLPIVNKVWCAACRKMDHKNMAKMLLVHISGLVYLHRLAETWSNSWESMRMRNWTLS